METGIHPENEPIMQSDDPEISIEKEIQESTHFHTKLEVIFQIEGELEIRIRDRVYHLKKQDVIAVNPGLQHSVRCAGGGICCRVFCSAQLLRKLSGSGDILFSCNSAADADRSYRRLSGILRELVYQEIRQDRKTKCLSTSLFYQMLDCLIEEYQTEGDTACVIPEEEGRLRQILQFIDANYQDDISLSELAEQLFISKSTLSRFFKKHTGIYFADYLSRVRCRAALSELEYTDLSITRIAMNNGFSNVQSFNRIFREHYGAAPAEYRKQKREEVGRKAADEERLRERLRKELEDSVLVRETDGDNESISVSADGRKGEPYEKNWNKVINIGPVGQLLQANLQFHTEYLVENLKFSYVRIWNIFTKKMMITDGRQIDGYNYTRIDSVFDFLVSRHIHIFLDFSKRPNVAVKGEEESIHLGEEYVEFQSREAWEALLRDFIAHAVKRYGRKEVGSWIFEAGFDLHHQDQGFFYQDPDFPFDYMEAFLYFCRTVRELIPEAQVGGPMASVDWDLHFQKQFFTRCREQDCIPDFISYILFPYESVESGGTVVAKRSGKKEIEYELVSQMRSLMKGCGLGQCRLYIVEWNSSVSDRNYLNDSCFRGAYIARKLSELWGMADLVCLQNGSDWVGSYYDTVRVANGGSGLITTSGIRKPAFFVMEFLNSLGDYVIGHGKNCIITRSEHYSYYILCFHYKWYGCNYFLEKENMDDPGRVNELFEDMEPLDLEIRLTGMPRGRTYIIKKRTVNGQKGSILDEWKEFQYESGLGREDVKYLREVCFPRMSMEKADVKDGELLIRQTLQAHEVSLLHIYEAE